MTPHKYFSLLRVVFLISVVVAGLWTRSLVSVRVGEHIPRRWPWGSSRTVTLYFTEEHLLVPVSRHMPAEGDLPRAALQALIAGPRTATNLVSSIPRGVEIRSVKVTDKVAYVDLSAAFRDTRDMQAAEAAILETLTELPGITSVALSIEGMPLGEPQRRNPLIYYASANGLAAIPSDAGNARSALSAYLAGPSHPELTGLPADVQVLRYDYSPSEGLLSLNFKYTRSLHELALEKPERIRLALLGLIATLTEFPEVRAVELDFQGHSRLGLGQCSDLLRTPQPRPQLLNDERLMQ